jgi:hypothetical protein
MNEHPGDSRVFYFALHQYWFGCRCASPGLVRSTLATAKGVNGINFIFMTLICLRRPLRLSSVIVHHDIASQPVAKRAILFVFLRWAIEHDKLWDHILR